MATIYRVRCTWTGFAGGSGVSTHYFLTTIAASDITALKTFWAACAGVMPNTCTVTVPNTGDILNDATGGLGGTWTTGTSGTSTGAWPNAFAAGTGAAINWFTGAVVGRRRLRGRTFVAPITGADYDTDGTLTGATVTALSNAAAALVTACPSLAIWHRPVHAAGGQAALVTASSVTDVVRSLRSRR